MVRSIVCYVNHPDAPMLQECHLIGSVRLEAMIILRVIAMTVLVVVSIPTA